MNDPQQEALERAVSSDVIGGVPGLPSLLIYADWLEERGDGLAEGFRWLVANTDKWSVSVQRKFLLYNERDFEDPPPGKYIVGCNHYIKTTKIGSGYTYERESFGELSVFIDVYCAALISTRPYFPDLVYTPADLRPAV